ncbi:hypothetical protein CDAR_577701 [Caerostris darwini]|uniref:Uncharacterized protein n=1 Tax=Caerostris darwini TaxID=1538125 RepID=A0AAV4RJN7_9ARAC|nr:hypothetical protein CDAR_577701 [Caerostris darwini]
MNENQIKKQQLSSHRLPDTILFLISFGILIDIHVLYVKKKRKKRKRNILNTSGYLITREFIYPSANPFPSTAAKLTREIPAKATFTETRHVAFKQTGWSWEQSKNKASSISGALSFSAETLCQIVSGPTLLLFLQINPTADPSSKWGWTGLLISGTGTPHPLCPAACAK